jgi:hypothetical protein
VNSDTGPIGEKNLSNLSHLIWESRYADIAEVA